MATATMELVDSSSNNCLPNNNQQLILLSQQAASSLTNSFSSSKVDELSLTAGTSNGQTSYRGVLSSASSVSSMSSTSLTDTTVYAGNAGESSPATVALSSANSSERLSLDSNNGPGRKMGIYNGAGIATSDERPPSAVVGNNSTLRPSTSNNTNLLHSPNNSNRSLTSPPLMPTSSIPQHQPPSLSHHVTQHPSSLQPGPSTPPMVHTLSMGPQFGNGPNGPYQVLQQPMNGRQLPDQHPGLPIQQPFPGYPPAHLSHFMPIPMSVVNTPLGRPSMQTHQLQLQRPLGHPQLGPNILGMAPGQPQLTGPMFGGPVGINLPHRIPSSDDACASIVHSLMDHRQGGDSEQFTKRAVESLVKKLRERKEELEALIFAVTTGGAQRTRCVTIQRTLDGRLQVAGKKGFPHVIYAKIWRWPDLHKNELRHVSSCQFAFDLKLDSVCVNPFHYERVVSPCPDLVPMSGSVTNGEEPSPGPSYQQQYHIDRSPGNSASPDSPTAQVASPPLLPVPQLPSNAPPVSLPGSVFSPASFTVHQPTTTRLAAPPGSVVIASPQQPVPTSTEDATRQPGYSNSAASAFSTLQSQCVMFRPPVPSVGFKAKPPPLATPLELWCTINYFELNVQVGQPFKVPFACRTVIVDGFTDPNGVDRFCLGCLSNVHRDEVVERARPHIGKGVELRHDEAGDVWLKVLSEHSVFLESPYLDSQFGGRQAVHKIYSSAELKVFDLEYCYQQMYDQAQLVHLAKNMLRATVKGNAPTNQRLPPEMLSAPNIGVDDYQKHCVLRMSFVKGFGPDYNRKRIEDTPCWIEVKLHWPLKLLDQLLQPLDDPQFLPQSQSQASPAPPTSGPIFMEPSTSAHHPQLHSHSSPSSSADIGQPASSSAPLLFQQ